MPEKSTYEKQPKEAAVGNDVKTIDAIDAQIKRLQAERDNLQRRATAARLQELRARYCVRAACLVCRGTKTVPCGGADMLSDPPYLDACDECEGRGWVWAVRFDRLPLPRDVCFDDLLND